MRNEMLCDPKRRMLKMMIIFLPIVVVTSQCIEDGDCDKYMYCDVSIYHCKTCISCSDYGRTNKTNIVCSKNVIDDCGNCKDGYKQNIENVLKCDYMEQGDDNAFYAWIVGAIIAVLLAATSAIIIKAKSKIRVTKPNVENGQEPNHTIIQEGIEASAPSEDKYYQLETELSVGAKLHNAPIYVRLPTPALQQILGPDSPAQTNNINNGDDDNINNNNNTKNIPALPPPATNDDNNENLLYAVVPYVPKQ